MDKTLAPLHKVFPHGWFSSGYGKGQLPGPTKAIPLPLPSSSKTNQACSEIVIKGDLQIKRRGPKIFTLRHLVMAYAIFFLIVKAYQFGKDVKVTVEMLSIYSNSPRTFYRSLHEKSNKVFWQSPSPSRVGPISILKETLEEALPNEAQMKTDVHVWNSFLFLQGLEYLFAWLLVFSVKNKFFEGIFAWLCFAVPVFFLYALQMFTSIMLNDLFDRNFTFPSDLCVELMLQAATMLMALVYLRRCGSAQQMIQLPGPGPAKGGEQTWQINLKGSGSPILLV